MYKIIPIILIMFCFIMRPCIAGEWKICCVTSLQDTVLVYVPFVDAGQGDGSVVRVWLKNTSTSNKSLFLFDKINEKVKILAMSDYPNTDWTNDAWIYPAPGTVFYYILSMMNANNNRSW